MAVEQKLILQAVDKSTGKVHAVSTSIKGMSRSIKTANTGLKTMRQVLAGIGASAVIFKLTQSFKDLAKSIITSADKIRLMQMKFKAVGAPDYSSQVMDFARKNPIFGLAEIQDAFVKLYTAGIDPTSVAMQRLVDAVAAFGGTAKNFQSVILAIFQTMGKGVLSMDEMRRQLGQQIPNALKLAAKEMGMSLTEFNRQVMLGKIDATSGVAALIKGLKKYEGAASDFGKTLTGMFKKLETEWDIIKSTALSDEQYNKMKNALSGLINTIKEDGPGFVEMVADMTVGFVDLAKEIKSVIKAMRDYFREERKSRGGKYALPKSSIKLAHDKASVQKKEEGYAYKTRDSYMLDPPNISLLAEDIYRLDDMTIKATRSMSDGWKTFWAGFTKQTNDATNNFKERFKNAAKVGEETAKALSKAMSSAFNQFFLDAIEGKVLKFRDYLLSFLKEIAAMLAKIASQKLAEQILGQVGNYMTSGNKTPTSNSDPEGIMVNSGAGTTGGGGGGIPGRGKAQMRAPTNVQVINNSGTPVEGTSSISSDEVGNQVMTIVLDSVNRNKSGSRDALRGMLAT